MRSNNKIAIVSVKDWCISPHGWTIAGPPDQSSPNSGNKCRLLRLLMLRNFVALWPKMWKISAVENFLLPGKVNQSSPKSLKTYHAQMPLIVPNLIVLAKRCTRKALPFSTFFSIFNFGVPVSQRDPWAKINWSRQARTINAPNFVPFW